MNLWNLPGRLGIVPRACAELLSATACNGVATNRVCPIKLLDNANFVMLVAIDDRVSTRIYVQYIGERQRLFS